MFDLDNFKEINDRYGHQAGDAVLQQIAALMPGFVRKSDYLARYGGEEFVLVLRDTGLYAAVQFAHKLRKLIEERGIEHNGQRLTVTASVGVASLERKQDGASLLQEADERLYESKRLGKNTVIPSMLPFFADTRRLATAAPNAPDRQAVGAA
jgi:diguanylate cyclase (GGDEF)-like protein